MELTREICYEAHKQRNADFDGVFFTAVSSTGIFCRPVCPAPTPKLQNCIFLPSATVAIERGYRACLRCRPESAPYSPAWKGVATTVERALKLIEQGALDQGSVVELSKRLGISDRYLRLLFSRHVGASPSQVAQSFRLFHANRLINGGDLPVNEVALKSGFGSIRRFNDAFVKVYGHTPSELRRGQLRE